MGRFWAAKWNAIRDETAMSRSDAGEASASFAEREFETAGQLTTSVHVDVRVHRRNQQESFRMVAEQGSHRSILSTQRLLSRATVAR